MEIDLVFFAQRVAMLSCLAGFVGGLLFVLVHGAVVAIADRLRARACTLQRIASARHSALQYARLKLHGRPDSY